MEANLFASVHAFAHRVGPWTQLVPWPLRPTGFRGDYRYSRFDGCTADDSGHVGMSETIAGKPNRRSYQAMAAPAGCVCFSSLTRHLICKVFRADRQP